MWRFIPLMLVLVTSCQSTTPSTSHRHQNQHMTLNIFMEVSSLDPRKVVDAQSHNLLVMLFEPLMRRDINGQVVPGAAQSVDISEDGLFYTFHLRPAVWSNGDPVTAHDYVYAWRSVLTPNSLGEYAFHNYVIKGAKASVRGLIRPEQIAITALNDQTMRVELAHPAPYFLELVQLPSFFPVHKKTAEQHPNWASDAGPQFVNNGPFLLDSWDHHNQITLVRNPNYWDAVNVHLNKIEMLMVADSNTELALFDAGMLDWTGRPISMDIPTEAMPALASKGKVEFHPAGATYYYFLNTEKPPLDNVKMRKALAYAINRQAMIDNIMRPGDIAATRALPPSLALRANGHFKDANIVEARRLFNEALAEMRLTKEELPLISISYNSGESHHKIAQAIQEQWSSVFGIEIGLSNMEWKVYLDNIKKGNYSVGRVTTKAWYNDPLSLLDVFKHKDVNFARWENPRFVRLLDQAIYEKEPIQRRRLLADAEAVLINDMPVIPLFFPTLNFMRSPNLKNVYLSPLGDVDFRHAYFET